MPFFLVLIYGFLAAAAALLLEIALGGFSLPNVIPGIGIVILSAFLEEGSKWIFFRQFRLRFDLSFSLAFPLGLLFGIGFSLLEFSLLVYGFHTFSSVALAGIVFFHIVTSLFYSYYLFRLAPRTLYHTLWLIFFMTLLHAVYNVFALR